MRPADGSGGARSLRTDEQFIEGRLSHVGDCFDLLDGGRPLRILIVSNQVGESLDGGGARGHEHVTVEGRRSQVNPLVELGGIQYRLA
jgi:hypothetical protein